MTNLTGNIRVVCGAFHEYIEVEYLEVNDLTGEVGHGWRKSKKSDLYQFAKIIHEKECLLNPSKRFEPKRVFL